MDYSAEAVRLVVVTFTGLITGFFLGSIWRWILWARG